MQVLGVPAKINITLHAQEMLQVVINRKIEFIYLKQTRQMKVLIPSMILNYDGKCLFDEFCCEINSLSELERFAINYYLDKSDEFEEAVK